MTAALVAMTESGDFARLDANNAKRQHFVPRFQLRGFAHEHKGKDCLFQMDARQRGAARRVDVETAASRHRLYAVRTDEGTSNRLEGYLGLVETHAAPALRRLLVGSTGLSAADRATIAYLVALQTMRTPSAAQQVTRIANAALKTTAGEFFSDSAAVAELYRKRFDVAATDETVEDFRLRLLSQLRAGEITLNGSNGAAFATAFRHAIATVPLVIACHWTLLRSPGGGLITSDRGYAIHDPSPPYPWAAQGLTSSEHVQLTVPLSDCACLLITPGAADADLDAREVSADQTESINLRTYGWAETYIFGKSQATLDAIRVSARRHPSRVIRPRPFCHVALLEIDPDDNSLAVANARRGWPPQLENDRGELCDYIVIPDDEPYPELWQHVDELAERRARKQARLDDETVVGHMVNRTLHPLDVSPSLGELGSARGS